MFNYDEHESIYDEWGYHESANVSVDFLLPTGIYIPMDVPRNATIRDVKKSLWKEAIHHPLFRKLINPESYTFIYITRFGLPEEIVDENKHLSESGLMNHFTLSSIFPNKYSRGQIAYEIARQLLKFDLIHELPVLKLVQSQGNIEEKRILQEIHQLTGIMNHNDLNVDAECVSFRKQMRELALEVSQKRDSLDWKSLLENHYPPSVIPFLNEHTHVQRDYGLIQLKYENIETIYTIKVNPNWKADDLTSEAVQTWEQKSKIKLPTTNPDDYVLKGTGKEFIIGDHKIYAFKCLREALIAKRDSVLGAVKTPPVLTLMHVGSVRQLLPEASSTLSQIKTDFPPPVPEKSRTVWSLWQTDQTFSVRVLRAINATQEKDKKLIVHVGLYHGLETLCATSYTKEHSKEGTGDEFFWEEDCFFDIPTCDLPRNSKLCITICTMNKAKKKAKEINHKTFLANSTPIAWVNMNVFDYKGFLKMGVQRLTCWKVNVESNNLDSNNLKPNGVVTMTPSSEEAIFLEISMLEFPNNILVKYPSHAEVLEEAARQASSQKLEIFPSPSKSHILQLSEIVKKDRFDDLFDNEKSLLWFLRLDCRDLYPDALAKVVSAVKWNKFQNVALIQAMLEAWPPLNPERAMELLDCQYADERVRDFAVECLKRLRDDELQQYLLQLVQVLKFDSYINSSLVRFLLSRAWKNRKIGHFLFWHLKSEITASTTNIRFSLILEAYLYGNIPHMKALYKQFEALNKMKTMNERVKSEKISQKDVKTLAKKALQDTANQSTFAEALSQVECPLEPNINLQKLAVESCKVMNSKMRPLWLEFLNSDHPEGTMSLIYKNGDDLRQDMLTLQIISIMDMLWKSEGLDLRMIPYGCLATGEKCGMIQVVTHANTIANIQKSKAGKMSSAFRHQSLFEWIEHKAANKEGALEQALENFTYSCAGYCVATYVLGVGDRHSDNIMVTETGQLFHIDFGHILGNFKSKYGIKRERVPFVLAHDFVHVINKGKTNEKKEFEVFSKLCDHAFCILRKKGYLFITLFALMLHSGLPELTSLEHLEYLRDTLALHLTEEKALQQFRTKFKKALADAWSTSLNWFFHNVHRN